MGAALSEALGLDDCPTGSRLLGAAYLGASVGVSAVSLRRPCAEHFLCCLHTVFQRRNVWALLTSAWYRPLRSTMDAMTLLSELYVAKEDLTGLEVEVGSARFLTWSIMTTAGVNVVFLALMKFMGGVGVKGTRFSCIQGLWPLVMARACSRALRDPPQLQRGVFGLARVPSRWYPFALAVGLSALHGSVQWDTLAAVVYGYACGYARVEDRLLLSRQRAQALEDGWVVRLLRAAVGGCWLPPDDPRPPALWAWWPRGDADRGRRERPGGGGGPPGRAGEGLQLFGGQGHRLGS